MPADGLAASSTRASIDTPVVRLTSDRIDTLNVDMMGWAPYTHAVHDDVIKWKHFPRYWPFVRGIHRSTVNSPHKGQWRGALMFSLMCARINSWVNNREAGDLRRYRCHYDVIVTDLWHFHPVIVEYMDDFNRTPPTTSQLGDVRNCLAYVQIL